MSMAARSTDHWVVFHHTHAQVPTVEAKVPGLEIHLFGLPDGFAREEVEGWIASLAAASREGAVAASPDDPIPPVLRHVLGGLLFTHAELWGRSSNTPCSIVLVHEHGRVAFGWVGNAAARIHVDGHEVAPEWVSVRDHQGRESHAWCGDARQDIRIELFCATGSGSDPTPVQLEIEWAGAPRAGVEAPIPAIATAVIDDRPTLDPSDVATIDELEVATPGHDAWTPDAMEAPEPITNVLEVEQVEKLRSLDEIGIENVVLPSESADAEPAAAAIAETGALLSAEEVMPLEDGSSAEDRPSTGVARWLAQALGWRKKPAAGETAPAVESGSPAPVSASEVPEEAVALEEVVAREVTSADARLDDPVDLVALPSEDPSAPTPPPTWIDVEPQVEPILPPEVPAQIPPTPEPTTLTARAVQSHSTLEDPRSITLPGEVPAAAAPVQAEPAAAPVDHGSLEPENVPPTPLVGLPEAAPEWRPVTLPPSSVVHEPAAPAIEPAAGESGDSALPAEKPSRRARRPSWPKPASPPFWQNIHPTHGAIGAAIVLVLFGGGWLLGSMQNGDERKPSPVMSFLRRVGIAGARFDAMVSSKPEGAAISVDGKDTGQRTPATLELTPGEHRVDLSFPDLGGASYMVSGGKGEKIPLEATLWGSVDVTVSDSDTPIAVEIDGASRGFAPLQIDSLAPGPHDLRFTGPGMASWGTTVEVRVAEVREVLAYPLQSPATGLLQIRASLTQDGENQPLAGARVFIDGDARGMTPLTLELARGPHSVKVVHQKETAPVQVIDLPGGNQRFATFEFGLDGERPALTLRPPPQIPTDEPVLVSATLAGVGARDVREMWLHVRTVDHRWRRYPMTLIDAQGSGVGAAPFPSIQIGPEGTRYYVSALTSQGDEYFTEMQSVSASRRAN